MWLYNVRFSFTRFLSWIGLTTFIDWKLTETGFIRGLVNGSGSGNDSILYSPWTVTSGGLYLRLDFESSRECAPDFNNNIQSANAWAVLQVTSPVTLAIHWSGAGELLAPGFERMSLNIDGFQVATASSQGGGQANITCTVGPVISDPSPPISHLLSSGGHNITISLTTVDSQFHKDAFYDFVFSFSN